MSKTVKLQLLLLVISFLTGCKQTSPVSKCDIVVTNSYIAAAVRDIYPDLSVLTLAPPGMCPGHFDLSPAQIKQLLNSKILLCFDFQSGMISRMERLRQNGLKIAPILSVEGLCKPQSYIEICTDTAEKLKAIYPKKADFINQRLNGIEQRMSDLENQIKQQIQSSGLINAKVLSSVHQAEFASYLGLNVVSTFISADLATASGLDTSIKQAQDKEIKFVIANQQEGTELAGQLGKRLNAKVVVFTNFPQDSFDNMINSNINQLISIDGDL